MLHIGKYIKKESKRFGITQEDLARLTGKSVSGIRKDFAKEEMAPKLITVYSIALGINLFEVLAKDFSGELGKTLTVRAEDSKETITINLAVDRDNMQKLLKLLQP